MRYNAIVIGASAGGMDVLRLILGKLPNDFDAPVFVVQHLKAGRESSIVEVLGKSCSILVEEAKHNERPKAGVVYIAPPDYHLVIEKNGVFCLSTDEKVNHSRPSIDVLFETAADAYGNNLIGIILTGASGDGSKGLLEIKKRGGLCIVQEPTTAFFDVMPKSALEVVNADFVLSPDGIAKLLINLNVLRRGM